MPRNPRLRLRRHLADLERARDAVASAKEAGADQWRVTELQLRYDRLQSAVLALEDDGPPPGRTLAPLVPVGGRRRG